MAKIIKITGYLVCPDMDDDAFFDESRLGRRLDPKSIEEVLNDFCDAMAKNFKLEDRDIGEWDDNCALNYVECPASECEKYFTDDASMYQDLVLIGKNADKISPENRKKLFEIADVMFKEDFGE